MAELPQSRPPQSRWRFPSIYFWTTAVALSLVFFHPFTSAVSSTLTGSGRHVDIAKTRSQRLALPPDADTYTITLTPDSLTEMMNADLAANQDYLTWLKTTQGQGAADGVAQQIMKPYQQRMDMIRQSGADHEDVKIPIVTVWGSLSFSTMSYDSTLGPKDPVSLLFVGSGSVDNVYADMTTPRSCTTDACAPAAFQDDKGNFSQSQAYQCRSTVQWVLMGDAGQPLHWQLSSRGLMKTGDSCMDGTRDHMRIFGTQSSDVFGAWSVGTPHRELWVTRMGHQVQSWSDARDSFAGYWLGYSKSSQTFYLGASGQRSFGAENSGIFQNVSFDGQAVAIEVCPCP